MIHLLLFLLSALGFGLLCLARDRHQRDLVGRKLATGASKWLRGGGFLCLLLAYAIAGVGLGWARGTLEWLGQLSAGALLIVFYLARLSSRKSSAR